MSISPVSEGHENERLEQPPASQPSQSRRKRLLVLKKKEKKKNYVHARFHYNSITENHNDAKSLPQYI